MNRHPLSMSPKPTRGGHSAHTPGGCDDCDAETAIERVGRITKLTVHHDETCPTYRAHQGRRGRT